MIPGLYPMFNHWHQNSAVWIYSDPHFGDKELAVGQSHRPTDQEQVDAINRKCGRADTLIILGDVGDVSYVKKLRARYKILIAGNHDAGMSNYQRVEVCEHFDKEKYTKQEAIEEMKKMYPDCAYSVGESIQFHQPFESWTVYADNKLFDEVYSGPLMIGEKLMLSHEPLDIKWAFNIHGHVHAYSHKNDKYHFNCCAEAINFSPINFNQWMKMGYIAKIESIHRSTIDTATIRKAKRIKNGGVK